MRVLGIDPGSRVMGLGLVESRGESMLCAHARSVRMGSGPLDERLGAIFEAVSEALIEFEPQAVAVERVFLTRNVKSALVLGHARGSAICAAVVRSLPVSEYSAREIKQSVVGRGAATKEQVQHMVRVLLGLRAAPEADAADALACAVCHINASRVADRIAARGASQ